MVTLQTPKALTHMGVGEPCFGVLIIRILLFRVSHWGPLFSETPTSKSPLPLLLELLQHHLHLPTGGGGVGSSLDFVLVDQGT